MRRRTDCCFYTCECATNSHVKTVSFLFQMGRN